MSTLLIQLKEKDTSKKKFSLPCVLSTSLSLGLLSTSSLAIGGNGTIFIKAKQPKNLSYFKDNQKIEKGIISQDNNHYIGFKPNMTGSFTVSGLSLDLRNLEVLHIGFEGNGILTVSGGGLVSSDSIIIASEENSMGRLNIGDSSPNPNNATRAGTLNVETVSFGSGKGSINFNHLEKDYLVKSAITGKGEINIVSGKTIFTGTNTFTGKTTILNGSLQIGNGGTKGRLGGNIMNDSELIFCRSDNITYRNITGKGSLIKTGKGNLTLEGENTYTGITHVKEGTLKIKDTVQHSPIIVAREGTLEANGRIKSLSSSGVTTLGDKIAKLIVTEKAHFDNNHILKCKVGPEGQMDQIIALDTLTLGGTLSIIMLNDNAVIPQTYTILSSPNRITTQFTSTSFNSTKLNHEIIYNPNSVLLKITSKQNAPHPSSSAYDSEDDKENSAPSSVNIKVRTLPTRSASPIKNLRPSIAKGELSHKTVSKNPTITSQLNNSRKVLPAKGKVFSDITNQQMSIENSLPVYSKASEGTTEKDILLKDQQENDLPGGLHSNSSAEISSSEEIDRNNVVEDGNDHVVESWPEPDVIVTGLTTIPTVIEENERLFIPAVENHVVNDEESIVGSLTINPLELPSLPQNLFTQEPFVPEAPSTQEIRATNIDASQAEDVPSSTGRIDALAINLREAITSEPEVPAETPSHMDALQAEDVPSSTGSIDTLAKNLREAITSEPEIPAETPSHMDALQAEEVPSSTDRIDTLAINPMEAIACEPEIPAEAPSYIDASQAENVPSSTGRLNALAINPVEAITSEPEIPAETPSYTGTSQVEESSSTGHLDALTINPMESITSEPEILAGSLSPIDASQAEDIPSSTGHLDALAINPMEAVTSEPEVLANALHHTELFQVASNSDAMGGIPEEATNNLVEVSTALAVQEEISSLQNYQTVSKDQPVYIIPIAEMVASVEMNYANEIFLAYSSDRLMAGKNYTPFFTELVNHTNIPLQNNISQILNKRSPISQLKNHFNPFPENRQLPHSFRKKIGKASFWVQSEMRNFAHNKIASLNGAPSVGILANTYATNFGYDYEFNPNLILGVMTGYSYTDYKFNSGYGEGGINSYRLGFYGIWKPGKNWYVNTLVGYGHHILKEKKPVLGASNNSQKHFFPHVNAVVEAGYDFKLPNGYTLTPYMGMGSLYFYQKSKTKSVSNHAPFIQNKLGTQLSKMWLLNDMQAYGFIKVGYTYRKALSRSQNGIKDSLSTQIKSNLFIDNKPRNLLNFGGGGTILFSNNVYVSMVYEAEINHQQRSNKGLVRLGWKF